MYNQKLQIFIALALFITLGSCSLKKNTALTRNYRAFTTRFNIYFNGNEAYKEALKNFEDSYEDDYSQRLFLHPVSSFAEMEEVKNDRFSRAIEKSQKAIRLRSIAKRPVKKASKANDPNYKEFLKRGEYNPFLHQAWLLMARSQFFQGDFLSASTTFMYIIRHFYWLPETVMESQLWLTRCYTEMGWVYEAENTFSKIEATKVPKNLRGLYDNVSTLYYLKGNQIDKALPALKGAIKQEKSKSQKTRMTFLLGQLYAETGERDQAYECYKKVMRMSPPYRTYFNANIQQTEVMPSSSVSKIKKKLVRLSRDPRNKEYLDQVYYALGNLALSQKDTVEAIRSFETALEKSTRNGSEKAVAAIKLGDLTFEREDYLKAQPAYATAISILKKNDRDYERVSHLSGVLDNLATHAETVALQDSLLRLAAMPEDKRLKIIDELIAAIIEKEKKEAEAARKEEYENNKGNYQSQESSIVKQPTITNGDKSWYFYNPATVNAGKSEFQRRWGARKPEDDWRRRDKSAVFNDFASEKDSTFSKDQEDSTSSLALSNDSISTVQSDSLVLNQDSLSTNPKERAYYLQQIPFTEEAKENSNNLIQEGLYNMGIIFNQQLENLPLSIKTFNQLNHRYPENMHKLDCYYEIYLMYMRMNDLANADVFKQKILSEFPVSNYSTALQDPNYIENLRQMDALQNKLYEETYASYLSGDYPKVHANYEFVKKKWPLCELMPQFLFLHALSFVGEKNSAAFRENLEELTAVYGESTPAPLASLMIKGLAEGKELTPDGEPARGMIWKQRIIQNSDNQITDSVNNSFKFNPEGPHLLVLAFQTDSVQINLLLYDIARYNFTNFLVKDFDLETLTFNELSILVIKGFDNFDELSQYRLRMSLPGGLDLPMGVTPVMISESNFRLLLQGRSFDDYFTFMRECSDAMVEPKE